MFDRLKDPVEAIAQVVAVSGDGRRRDVTVSIQAAGLPAQTVQTRQKFDEDRIPAPGTVLAARVDRGDPSRFEIDWDQLPPSSGAAATSTLSAFPATTVSGAAVSGPGVAGDVPPEAQGVVSQLQQLFPGAQIQVETHQMGAGDLSAVGDVIGSVERAVGQDLDGDGTIGGSAVPPAGAAGGGDRLEQLERLARLRDDGDLTEEEFAAEKRRLLGGT